MEQRPCCFLQLLIDFLTQLLEYFLAGLTFLRGISTRLGCIATVSQRIVFIVHVCIHLAVKPLAAVAAVVAGLGDELVHLVQGGQGRHAGPGCAALGAHAAGTVVVILVRINVGGRGIVFLQVYGAGRIECAAVAPLLGCLQRLRFLACGKQDVSVGKRSGEITCTTSTLWLAGCKGSCMPPLEVTMCLFTVNHRGQQSSANHNQKLPEQRSSQETLLTI